ncbi:hypothetical protein X739_05020 [Mesorhizobium sp. LNHC220B00]|nr:hypothetical protein X739_05020 [Mesorhizobium sp. LNHC220B00]ESY93909.1 hypothetical protein X741_16690 [Mesorhizobium sp. LNHC229A00]
MANPVTLSYSAAIAERPLASNRPIGRALRLPIGNEALPLRFLPWVCRNRPAMVGMVEALRDQFEGAAP